MNKSHYVYIKDFNRFMLNKTKNNKKHFHKNCLHCFRSEKSWKNTKKFGSIKFKNNFKRLAVPFNIYADMWSIPKEVKNNYKNNASYTKKRSYSLQPCLQRSLY